jgi:hypothetical protein
LRDTLAEQQAGLLRKALTAFAPDRFDPESLRPFATLGQVVDQLDKLLRRTGRIGTI